MVERVKRIAKIGVVFCSEENYKKRERREVKTPFVISSKEVPGITARVFYLQWMRQALVIK